MKIKHLISTLLLSASLVTAGITFAHQESVEKAEAAYGDDGKITIYFSGLSDFAAITGVQIAVNNSWGAASKTTTDLDKSIGQYKYQYTTNSNQTALNAYITSNDGKSQWFHPYSGSKDWDTKYSTIKHTSIPNLQPGHSYVITFTSWNYSYDNWEHAWFNYSFAEFDLEDPATTTNQFYVYDPDHKLGTTFNNVKVYGFGQSEEIKPMSWPGTHNGITNTTLGGRSVYSVSLSTSYPSFSMTNKNEGNYQTGDLTISGNTGKVLGIDSSGNTSWINSSEFTSDCPATDGYYLVAGNHAFTNKRMTDTTGDNQAEYLNYEASSGEVLNIRSCFLDTNPPKHVGSFGGGETPFGHKNSAGDFVFTKNAVVNIYAKWESSVLKFYLASSSYYGYYMVGDSAFMSEFGTSGTAFTIESGVKMNSATGGNKAVYTFTIESTITMKARSYTSEGDGWVMNTEASKSAVKHGVKFDDDGNYVIPAGTYSLYIFEKNAADASSLTWGIPLDSYTAEFMSYTGSVCKGSATVESELASVWAYLREDWAFLSAADQNTLRTATASETGTQVEQVMARYDVIIYNHPSFNDYMSRKGNANYTYKGIHNLVTEISNNAPTALIAIVSVSITGLAVGGYFFLKKKKEN